MDAALSTTQAALPRLTPAHLNNESLESSITTLAANIAAATWQLLALIAEFDRREAWGGWGIQSCAHWLNWKCGIALGAAREKLRVAHALAAVPQISAAFAAGELSYSKVRAMTRVATPANEAYLLMIARHGTAVHVEQAVRAYRRVLRKETAAAARMHADRRLAWYYDGDGMFVMQARLPAEAGAMLLKALAAAGEDLQADVARQEPGEVDLDYRADVPAGTSEAENPASARRADALCHLAEQFLAHGPVAMKQADRHQIVVHVDRESLRIDGHGERCELEHGPALAAESVRRLACDASIVEVAEDPARQPLDIGRKTRVIPPAPRRALTARDGGCRFPGCTHTRYVDAHHIRHWADGGETSARNLALLCRRHHRLMHEGGFTLERRDDGKLLFLRPDGLPIPEAPSPIAAVQSVTEYLHTVGIDVPAGTRMSLWAGERMDIDLVVLGFLQCDRRMADVPAHATCDVLIRET